MATKTTKGKKTAGIDVPAMPALSPNDLLAQLVGDQPVATPEKKAKRPVMEMTPQIAAALLAWAPVDIMAGDLDNRAKLLKTDLDSQCYATYLKIMWANKQQPCNPNLEMKNAAGQLDVKAQYQVKSTFSVQASSAVGAIEALVGLGLASERAQVLVAAELDFTPITIIPFTELIKGHKEDGNWVPASPVEISAATKILNFVLKGDATPLTADERKVAIQSSASVKVKEGFLERVTTYASTFEELQAILSVIKPSHFPLKADFGISDNFDTKKSRLLEVVGTVIGTED